MSTSLVNMPLFVFLNLLFLIGIHAKISAISEVCSDDGNYCLRSRDCCSEKCEYSGEKFYRTCVSERENINDSRFGTTTPLSAKEPTFCLLYGQCEINNDCCSKECIVSKYGTAFNQCKENRRTRKI